MKNKFSVLTLFLATALALSACGTSAPKDAANTAAPTQQSKTEAPKAAEELTIKHQLGETKVKKNPTKVVAFDFGALDTLDKLGVEVVGVPQPNLPAYLAKYKDAKYKNVGSVVEPDFEKINAIGPDLILISGRQQSAYAELSKIAPTVFVGVDTKNYMESFKTNTKVIGSIFGKEKQAEDEFNKVSDTIKAVQAKSSAGGKNALIALVNGGKISVYGQGSRFGLIHDVLGFKPVDTTIQDSTHGQSVSVEYIVQKDPDYLFVIDRDSAMAGGNAAAKQVIENELVKKTKAFKNGTIVYLDANYWYLSGGGLVSVSEMVKEVEKAVK